MLRKIALNLIKQHSTAKISLKARRKKAAWDDQYMTQIISGNFMRKPWARDPKTHRF
jgi:hypothetical protein